MKKRNQYKNFNDYQFQNRHELKREYETCGDNQVSFDDYCLAQWQRLD